MSYRKLDLIYHIKWQRESNDLPSYVKILNEYSNIPSHRNDNTFIFNKKDFKDNTQLADILYNTFNTKVENFTFERSSLEIT